MNDTATVKSLSLENGETYELTRYKGKYMTETASVLAKLIVKGRASLYQAFYKGDGVFIITKNGTTYPLQNDKLELGLTELTTYDYKIVLNSAIYDAGISRNKIEKTSFDENDFIALVTEYNNSVNSDNKVIAIKRKPVRYIIAYAGGMIKNSKEKEVYVQTIYRTYFPKISRS